MSKRRVVITGLGIISPLGNDVAETWENIRNGKSGIGLISHFDTSAFSVRIGGSIKNFDPARYITPKDIKKMDPFIHYGMAAGSQAIEDSGLEVNEKNAHRVGVAVGSGIGGLPGIEKGTQLYLEGGPRKLSPFFVPSNIINMISGNLSIKYGAKGPNFAIVTACATGTHNIGDAARLIEYGDADVMIAGGAEMATSPTGLGGFAAARALSTRNDDPEGASRPWDRDRDGFVLSDGAGVIVLEEYEYARKRGARIYAELIGYGMSGDAYHMTAPSEDGDGAARCMENALHNASINPDQVDYINAHGTSTPAGDVVETMVVKRVFGDHAKKLAISSTKSMIGHMLGAAGGVEAIFSILSIQDQVAPPTINLDNPDPECDLDYVPNTARPMKINIALSNSFGFGGTNGTLIFKRLD
ncbi:MAG: beta-ketoacyl-[acyl-carrier-protein] synthase II [Gammaproteobacteria bacterium RIFCSPLOWO2_12_FULL_47_76]|nr:MAG: beta-ketoacyl-[acyl-carrier-protein] synthase II [Gammaproteobacteria bacterium RIFCSPLOWO2_12_FULL_47_76]